MAVGNVRTLLLDLLARDKASPAINTVGDALDDMGDEAAGAARDLAKLDRQIADTERSIRGLAAEIARTGDLDLTKGLRRQQAELRKLTNVRSLLLPDPGPIGDTFGKGLAGAVTKGFTAVGPAGAIGAGLAAGLLPVIGASVSAAVLGGAGAGGIIGGVVLASRDARVQASATAIGDSLVSGLEKRAGVFVGPVLDSLRMVESRALTAGGTIGRVFNSTAGLVVPLTDALLDAAESGLGGLADAAEGAEPVFRALGEVTRDLGESVGEGLSSLSDNGAGAADALFMIGQGLVAITDTVFATVNGLTELYEMIRIYTAFAGGDYATVTRLATEAAMTGSTANDQLASSFVGVEEKAQAAADAQREMNDQVYAAAGLNISAAEANIRLAEALDAAKNASDGKAGMTRAEEEALLRVATASNAATQRAYEQGASAVDLKAKTDAARAAFINTATSMGISTQRARELASAYIAIPENVTTHLRVQDETQVGIQAVKNALATIPPAVFTTVYTNRLDKGRTPERWGGAYEHAAVGLLREAGVYSAANPGRYMIAEPQTGGEAFIPKNGHAPRSIGILDQAAGWYGMQVVPGRGRAAAARGGAAAAAPTGGGADVLRLVLDVRDPLLSQILRGLSGIYRTQAGRNVDVMFGGSRA